MKSENQEQYMKINLLAKTIGDKVSVECEISGECGVRFAAGVLKEVISKSEMLQDALPIALLDLKMEEIDRMIGEQEQEN